MKITGSTTADNERNDYKVIFCCIVDTHFRILLFSICNSI